MYIFCITIFTSFLLLSLTIYFSVNKICKVLNKKEKYIYANNMSESIISESNNQIEYDLSRIQERAFENPVKMSHSKSQEFSTQDDINDISNQLKDMDKK